jgi:murein DD-endopeptidase MepM/ murein hydrolase activator NlpD
MPIRQPWPRSLSGRLLKIKRVGSILQSSAASGWEDRLRKWFPDREFFMRSQGQVRFIKVSSRLQKIAAAAVLLLAVAWLGTMATVAVTHYFSTRERLALLDREAQVASAESRVGAYRNGLSAITSDLAKRQEVIEKLVQSHVGDLPADAKVGETVSDSSDEAAQTVKKVSAAVPEAAGLARLEARQLAFVEQMTRLADRRAASAAQAIRRLGLNPDAMLQVLADKAAQGGPFVALATSANGDLDPRFQRLGLSLERMSVLQRGLAGIPNHLPASLEFISSGFGYRADPFTGAGAFHAGLDFKGPYGAPIFAAAKGVVSFAGVKQGYGNCIEIDHGNGLLTRYAHMSAFRASIGQSVAAGTAIGAIGNSGRSTGPHLHFEVRINGNPVNPRPFLEAIPHVLEDASASQASR